MATNPIGKIGYNKVAFLNMKKAIPSPEKSYESSHMMGRLAQVLDVISDSDSPYYTGINDIGRIVFSFVAKVQNSTPSKQKASPLLSFQTKLPLKNEQVLIFNNPSSEGDAIFYYIGPLNVTNTSLYNPVAKNQDIKVDGNLDLGKGINEEKLSKINKCCVAPGDYIVEGRFGNSIRMGNSSNNININGSSLNTPYEGSENDPITIIRNGQKESPNGVQAFEDINNDNSSFYLTKGQKLPINVSSGNLETFGGELKDIVQNATPIEDSNEDYSTPIFNNDQIV